MEVEGWRKREIERGLEGFYVYHVHDTFRLARCLSGEQTGWA